MKKFISFIIALIVLSSCIGITSFAASYDVTLSEDFSELYSAGKTYSMVDASKFQIYHEDSQKQVVLSNSQKETVRDVFLETAANEIFFFADIKYKNGITLSISYLDNDYMDEYSKIINGDVENYTIDFYYPEGNIIEAKKEILFDYGNSVTLTSKDIDFSDTYDVYIGKEHDLLKIVAGVILVNDDDCFYVDFEEAGLTADEWYSIYDYPHVKAHKIKDEALLDKIYDAQDRYYRDDLGFFYDDDFTESISTALIIFVFAVIPLALFILFLILAILSKTVYKKLFTVICALSAAELTVFAIIAALFVTL